LFRKRKGNTLLLHCLISGLLAVSLLAQFPPLAQLPPSVGLFLPAAQLASSLAPRSAQRQPPAARLARPNKPRQPSLTRATAAASSSRPQPLTARARVSAPSPSSARLGNRPRERLSNRRPRSWRRGSIPRSSASIKRSRAPPRTPLLSPLHFLSRVHASEATTIARKSSAGHRPHLRAKLRPRVAFVSV